MKVLWLCGLPAQVQREWPEASAFTTQHDWPWILGHLPPPDGIELHAACLWPGGARRVDLPYRGCTFHLLPCPRRGRAATLFRFDPLFYRGLFRELAPDVVHGWGTQDSAGHVACRLGGPRGVVSVQGVASDLRRFFPADFRFRVGEWNERRVLRAAARIVVESRYSADCVRRACPTAEPRIVDHPLRPEFPASRPSDGETPTVLFVGALYREKGILEALHAFAAAAPEPWRLRVVGRTMPAMASAFPEAVARLGLGVRVRHDASLPVDGIVEAYRSASVFLLPTYVDTGPTSLKEALAMGLWPVCFDNSGAAENIRRFGFGSLARDRDAADLARVLGEALASRPWADAPRREACVAAARRAFSREAAWSGLRALYAELTGGSEPGRNP